jgi:uncharacterized protein
MRLLLLGILCVLLGATSAGADSGEDEAKAAYASGDYARAASLTRPFAERGLAWAQDYLGVMYQNGQGVSKDHKEAVVWYRKAAEQGYANAQRNLGLMYRHGTGVVKDEKEAVAWYRKAAEQGQATAQVNLGIMYHLGKGVLQDHAEAEKWYQKAAAQGNEMAQGNLGVMYEKTDRVRAYMWFSLLATLSSDTDAEISRDTVASQLTAEEITKAQKMARRCQETKFKECGYKGR